MVIESIDLVISVRHSECDSEMVKAEKIVADKCADITFFNTYSVDEIVFDSADSNSYYYIVTFM